MLELWVIGQLKFVYEYGNTHCILKERRQMSPACARTAGQAREGERAAGTESDAPSLCVEGEEEYVDERIEPGPPEI